MTAPVEEIRRALRLPYVPQSIARLAAVEGYLEFVWPQLASSVETAGFLGSARYMADMALDAVEDVETEGESELPALLRASLSTADLDAIAEVVDLFHYAQPQLLLLLAACAEAWDRDAVGGQGRPEPRDVTDRERTHAAMRLELVEATQPPLPEIAETLGLDDPPDLYRAVARWPVYLDAAWEELQHLGAYPDFRRRGRALYFYARAGARFLAQPLRANPAALRGAGLDDAAIEAAHEVLDAALPATATMMMHAEAMRLGLGVRAREVVG